MSSSAAPVTVANRTEIIYAQPLSYWQGLQRTLKYEGKKAHTSAVVTVIEDGDAAQRRFDVSDVQIAGDEVSFTIHEGEVAVRGRVKNGKGDITR